MYIVFVILAVTFRGCLPLDMAIPTEISQVSNSEGIRAICPSPQLQSGQRSWQITNQNVDVVLTRANIACQVGDPCTSSSPQDGILVSVLQVDLQLGDWLTLWLDVSEYEDNDSKNWTTLQLTINPMSLEEVYTCDVMKQPEVPLISRTADIKDNVSLGTEILTAGVHLFSVRLNFPSEICGLSWRLNITVKPQECSKMPSSVFCSGYGNCISEADKASFTCRCCPGYVGRYCGERDGCYGNPCKHGGFCVDISEGLIGTTYQCLCPHGYRGQSCEEEVSQCDKKPCHNNATCHGNQTSYYCDCPQGFTGKECETNINECLPNPCVHGVCEDSIAKYKCYCLPGYGGDHCEFEYDECDSSPCINAGACEDLVAGYRCHCGPGYKGRRCQIKVDLCQPNPCPPPAQCVDRGNNYSCICHPGYNGPGCTQHYDPCYPSPCQNGGTCLPSLDSFFCSCLPGYTGDICEERMYPAQPLPRTLEDTSVHVAGRDNVDTTDVTLDHLHNIYIAAATLAGACLIVLAVVVICHCRVHKTYQRFTRKLSRSCSDIKQQKLEDPDKFLLNLRGSVSERSHCPDPGYEATSVDLVDNLSAPLID